MTYKQLRHIIETRSYYAVNSAIHQFSIQIYWNVHHFLGIYRGLNSDQLIKGLEFSQKILGIPEFADAYNLYEEGRQYINEIDNRTFTSKYAYLYE